MKKIAKTLVDAKILDRALIAGVLCEAGFVARDSSGRRRLPS